MSVIHGHNRFTDDAAVLLRRAALRPAAQPAEQSLRAGLSGFRGGRAAGNGSRAGVAKLFPDVVLPAAALLLAESLRFHLLSQLAQPFGCSQRRKSVSAGAARRRLSCLGPSFRNQRLGRLPFHVEDIPHRMSGNVHSIEGRGEFANQPDPHTRRIVEQFLVQGRLMPASDKGFVE
jgi:hypothetical protein